MKKIEHNFDVIVIGGGHAGIEAAAAAARMGSRTALITLSLDKIGLMPCNPALGGIGKGHLVFEISALGGVMPQLATQTYIQARMLNTKKGPAVQGLRLQIDKDKYSALSRQMLEKMDNLTLIEASVDTILTDKNGAVRGISTENGRTVTAPAVVITTGTFLNGCMRIGNQIIKGGRRGEHAITRLAQFLYDIGLKMGRLKTGTPPRLKKESLDFSKMAQQAPDQLNFLFEFWPHKTNSTHACYITHTNQNTHDIISKNMDISPLSSANIAQGPRYCPSIEDKVHRFPHKSSHLIFVEPEGADSDEIYPNGISTSMPIEVQKQYIHSVAGFENAVITKPGYLVEYDFVLPHQLEQTLELKKVPGLFLAGQINGTTGYEEAGAQGLIAGANAHLKTHQLPPFILDRTESYIGVMINDLTTLGVDEPYRMFTSRAERRLILRQDNAFLRLTEKAHELGLVNTALFDAFKQEKEFIEQVLSELKAMHKSADLMQLFGTDLSPLQKMNDEKNWGLSDRALLTIHAEIRYEPYIKREAKEIERSKYYQSLKIPTTFVYTDMPGLSKELQQKLTQHQPATIANASLIPGMTPAALSLLIFKIKEK